MLELLNPPESDPILSLISKFHEDTRSNKIDLGVGVYKDEEGQTPIMKAVRNAAVNIATTEKSKSYIGPVGDERFNTTVQQLVLEGCSAISRASTIQTPGADLSFEAWKKITELSKKNGKQN